MRIGVAGFFRMLRHAGPAALLCLQAFAASAAAAELLRVGKSVPEAFSFIPLDVGSETGIFRKHGIEIEASALAGGALAAKRWRLTSPT